MKVAVIHYWLVNMRGGEKALEAILELYPEADVYTHVYNPKSISAFINSKRIFTSSINRLPFAKKLYQMYMPLMPRALMEFDLQKYDLIISSESGPAKGVVPNPDAYHVCYCHSPMRYLWDMYHEYYKKAGFIKRIFMKRLIPGLRQWDITSSNLVDCFVTNSNYVAKRIKRYYNRESAVAFGPADIERFIAAERHPREDRNYYLFFGQITGYKRADIAIEACIKSGRKIIIAGAGASKKDIKKYSKTGLVKFLGKVEDQNIPGLYSGAKALLFPGIEDFGLIPVEAQAAGCPVIAYGKGGVLDTVKENITGIFFYEQTAESLIAAIDQFEMKNDIFNDRSVFTEHVSQFSKASFKDRISKIISCKKRL